MAVPRDQRQPRHADPEHFLTGYTTGDPEDPETEALLDDLYTLGLWDSIDAWENEGEL